MVYILKIKKRKNTIMSNQVEAPLLRASEFNVKHWIDANGNKTNPIKLSDYKGKFKIIFLLSALVSWMS